MQLFCTRWVKAKCYLQKVPECWWCAQNHRNVYLFNAYFFNSLSQHPLLSCRCMTFRYSDYINQKYIMNEEWTHSQTLRTVNSSFPFSSSMHTAHHHILCWTLMVAGQHNNNSIHAPRRTLSIFICSIISHERWSCTIKMLMFFSIFISIEPK